MLVGLHLWSSQSRVPGKCNIIAVYCGGVVGGFVSDGRRQDQVEDTQCLPRVRKANIETVDEYRSSFHSFLFLHMYNSVVTLGNLNLQSVLLI